MRGATAAPKRPLVRYHGGKWKLAPWILRHLPAHRVYVEPFGGGGSVLLQKARSYAEVYNDLDGEIVNLFRVARDNGEALASAVELTPFARVEFAQAYEPSGDPLEQARRTLIRAFMGFGSAGASGQVTGFRANSNRSGTTPAHDWMNFPAHLRAGYERKLGGKWQLCCGDMWTGSKPHKCARALDEDGEYAKLRRPKSASSEGDKSSGGGEELGQHP
jgi:DNA adenine methylase